MTRLSELVKLEGNYYVVYRDGRVYSCYYRRYLVPQDNGRGYLLVRTKKKLQLISRLVAASFVPNPKKLPCVNHKNGNKKDNRAENLEWVSYAENTAHAISTGLINHKGEGHTLCKVSDIEVGEMRHIYGYGGISMANIGKAYGVSPSHAARIINGERREVSK
jgi:hypothetical protein